MSVFQIHGRVVFTTGYMAVQEKLKADALADLLTRMNLILADIRFNPWSQAPIWRRETMAERYGDRYLHLAAFGNKNYRGQHGEGVMLVNPAQGAQTLVNACAFAQRRPLMLCGCQDVSSCHREDVGRFLLEGGIVDRVIELGESWWNYRDPDAA